jgi:CspA family cold shock protein
MMLRFSATVRFMRTFVILMVGAALLAAAIVEIPSRLWPDSALALLAVAFIALLVQGWLGSRLLSQSSSQQQPATGKPRKANKAARADRPAKPAKAAKASPASSEISNGVRESGTVKWFNRSKGFGFIVRASGDEIFVHQRSIRGADENGEQRRPSLRDGQAVNFVVVERDKGLQAEDVAPE